MILEIIRQRPFLVIAVETKLVKVFIQTVIIVFSVFAVFHDHISPYHSYLNRDISAKLMMVEIQR